MESKKNMTFIAEVKRDKDGFLHARVKNLPHCYTQAKNLHTLFNRLTEVIFLCLEIERDDEAEGRMKRAIKQRTSSKREKMAILPFKIDTQLSSELFM